MPVETFGFVNALDASLPGATDGPSQGDDHIRGIKTTLKNQFPNLTAAVTATAAQLNQLATGLVGYADGSAGAPSIFFTSEPATGFRRSAAGVIAIEGRLSGDGAVPTGAICDFLNEPPTGWYELNGQAVSRTGATAALFALYGTFYGAGNGTTTFNLPSVTGRYRRGRDPGAGMLSGANQADQIKSFTAPVSVSGADHSHGNTFSIGSVNYVTPTGTTGQAQTPTFTGGSFWFGTAGGGQAQSPSLSGSINNSGSLNMTGTATYTGGTETRPLSIVVVTCVKA